jgi:hypothetical protein
MHSGIFALGTQLTTGCLKSMAASGQSELATQPFGESRSFVDKKGFQLAASMRCNSRFALANKTIRLQWSYRSFAFKTVKFLGLNVPCAR